MRRAITLWQDLNTGNFSATNTGGLTKNVWSVKEKQALIDGANTLQQLIVLTPDYVQPGETACNPPQPGRLVPVGGIGGGNLFGMSFVFPQLFDQLDPSQYNSLNNGDGADTAAQRAQVRAKTAGGRSGTVQLSLKSYLLLLLNTWQTVGIGQQGRFSQVPQRWIDWLTLLISHFDRYTPTQIYGFLARIDFSGNTFKV